jgi:hypothetical protein
MGERAVTTMATRSFKLTAVPFHELRNVVHIGQGALRWGPIVLSLDLLLRVCNPLFVSGMVGWPFLLEGSSPVLEEFLLPAVENRRLESTSSHNFEMGSFSSKCRLRMRPTLPARIASVASSCVLSISLTGERLLHFPTEPEQNPPQNSNRMLN